MPTTQLNTFSTAGYVTYTIPSWAHKIDVIALGGGGGGQGGGAGFNNGKSGAAGSYSAGLTLTRGVDFPWDKTTFRAYVGNAGSGGTGGASSNGQAGWNSALGVEYGAVGPGASGSGTNSVALSWTHTPYGYDNYVVVSLAVYGIGQGSFSTHTRTVTYGGTAMTFLGAVNANNLTNGWVESYGIAITPGASAQTVSVTVSKSGATYTNVKASSVSYGNVNAATVSAVTSFGNTSTSQSGVAYAFGGTLVGAAVGLGNTVAGISTLYTQAQRFINNTAPSFIMLDSLGAATELSFAAATPWGHVAVLLPPRTTVVGTGGAANSITWVAPPTGRGGSPGNKTFNGQTYVGGTGSLNTNLGAPPATATAPGAGGGGSGGFLLGLTALGGNGSAGRVWIFAYNQFADASTLAITAARPVTPSLVYRVSATLPITAAASGTGRLTGRFAASQSITSNRTVTGLRNALVNASQTITSTRTSTGLRNARVAAAQSITATRTAAVTNRATATAGAPIVVDDPAAVSRRQLLAGSLSANASLSAAGRMSAKLSATQTVSNAQTATGLRNARVDGARPVTATLSSALRGGFKSPSVATTVTAATSAAARLLAVGSATRLVTFAFTSTGHRKANVAAAQTVTATRSSNVRWDSKANVSRSITAAFTPHAVYDPKIQATVLPGFPYQLPLRFGVTVKAVFSAFVTRFQRGDVSQTVTATRSASLRGSLTGNITRPITANRPVTGLRNTFASASQTITATTTSAGLRNARVGAAQAITNTRNATGLRNAIVSDLTTNVTAARIASGVTNTKAASDSLSVSTSFSAAIRLTGSLASFTAITAARTATGLRNAQVAAIRPITATVTPGSVAAGFRINTALTVQTQEPTSVTEILTAVGSASGIVTAVRPAAGTRNARVDASLAVTANRPTTVKWDSRGNSSLLSVTALRASYAVYSTTVAAATMPGLPYELPLRFGVAFRVGTNATAGNAFTAIVLPATIVANRTATLRALWSTSASQPIAVSTNPGFPYELPFQVGGLQFVATISTTLTANRPVVATPTSQVKLAGRLSGSLSGTATFTSELRKNIPTQASLGITAGRTADGRLSAFAAGILAVSNARPAAGLRSVFADSSMAISATASTTALRNARVSSSTTITGSTSGSVVAGFKTATSVLLVAGQTAALRLLASANAAQIVSLDRFGSTQRTANVAASQLITQTSTSIANYNPRVSGSLATSLNRNTVLNLSADITATTLPGLPYLFPYRFGVTFYASGSGNASHVSTANVSLAVTAGRTSTQALSGKMAANLVTGFITNYPGLPYEFPYLLGNLNSKTSLTQGLSSLLNVNAVASSGLSQSGKIAASRPTVASFESSVTENNPIAALLVVKAKTVPCFPYYLPLPLSSAPDAQASVLRNARVVSSLSVTANRPANMGILVKADVSLAVNFVTNYPGFPYTLPHLLGRLSLTFAQSQSITATSTFSATANVTASRKQLLSATRIISANAQGTVANNNLVSANLIVRNALVPCFPYELPITLSSVPNARATALRDAKVAAQLSVTGTRPSLLGFLLRGNVSLAANFVTNYPGFPYTLPYLLGNLNAKIALSQSIQSLSVINSVGTANFSQNQKLQAARQITFATQITTLRDATIAASLLAKSSAVPTFPYSLPIPLSAVPNRQASAAREAKVSASRAINVKGMSPTFMPGLPFTFPFRFNQSPAPVMTLETRVPSLPTIITSGQSAESQRIANVVANQIVSATRQSNISIATNIDAELAVSPTQTVVPNTFPYTLPYIFAAIRAAPPAASAKISVTATSLLAINARMYGFPYTLPLKLGPVNAVLRRQFKSVLDINATATLTAGNKLSALIVANRLVSVGIPASAKYRTTVSVNTRPGFPFDLPLLLRGASFDITANRPAVAAKIHFVQSSVSIIAGTGNPIPKATYGGRVDLPVVSAITARMNASSAIASEQRVTAIITAFSRYRVNSAAALAVTLNRATVASWYTNNSPLLEVEAGTSSALTFAARFSANRPITVTPTVAIGSLHSLLSSIEGRFALAAAAKNNARAESLLAVNVIQSASMQMRARIASPTTLFVTQSVAVKADYRLSTTLGVISTAISSVAWRSSMASQSTIQALADTNESQNQDISSGHTSAYTNILSSALRTQYLAGINTSVTAPRSATTVLVYDGRASVTTNFSASASIKRNAYCEAVLGVSATSDIWPVWDAYAESTQLNIQTNPDTRAVKIRYLVSIGTPTIVTTGASAEMYHSAGSFVPFFYAGGYAGGR